jgi:hydroxyacylglutathione hydrolase
MISAAPRTSSATTTRVSLRSSIRASRSTSTSQSRATWGCIAIVDINRGPLLTAGVEVLPLASRQIEQSRADGALLVDVRTDLQFDEAHIPGSVCVTMLHAGFGTRLAWIAERDQSIVLIGRDDDDARAAAKLATAVGIRTLGGYLAGGMTSWRTEYRDVGKIERLRASVLADRLVRDPSLQILDVRERAEWADGHIPDSVNTPYHDVLEVPEGIDPGGPVAVICSSGQRSAVAASLLRRLGLKHVVHVADGGVGTWGRQGHPLER